MAPDVLSPQHSEASAPQPGMNGQANQARCLLPAQTLATRAASRDSLCSAAITTPTSCKRLDLPDEYGRSAGMDTAPLDRPPATTPTQHPHPTPSGPNTNSAEGDDQPKPPERDVDTGSRPSVADPAYPKAKINEPTDWSAANLLGPSRHSPGSRTRLDRAAN
jgi:hypothetical protein